MRDLGNNWAHLCSCHVPLSSAIPLVCRTYSPILVLQHFLPPSSFFRLWWTAVSCSMSAGNPMLKRAELVPYRNKQHVRYKRSKWAQTKTSGWTPRHSFEKNNVIPRISSVVIFLIFSTAALAIIVGVNHDSQHFIPMQHPFSCCVGFLV